MSNEALVKEIQTLMIAARKSSLQLTSLKYIEAAIKPHLQPSVVELVIELQKKYDKLFEKVVLAQDSGALALKRLNDIDTSSD